MLLQGIGAGGWGWVHGRRRDVDLDSAGAIESLRKVIWDRLREEGCHGRVPEGALEVVWERFLDL